MNAHVHAFGRPMRLFAANDLRSPPSFEMAESWTIGLQLILALAVGGVICFVIVWILEGTSFDWIQTLRRDLAIVENPPAPRHRPSVGDEPKEQSAVAAPSPPAADTVAGGR